MREEGFFDDLARGLADGTLTRGRALRLMGAALVGGSLASLGIREASADAPGCKRAGKNCTRDTQCCGNLVCPSGTCQTPTTTTTETPTTTTTETPTTTTTPMCQPTGGPCSTDGTPCCSGNCTGGFCCESGRVGFSNGTCALPCTGGPFLCPGVCLNCVFSQTPGYDALCTNLQGSLRTCSSDATCPPGEFCGTGDVGSDGQCVTAC